MPNDNPNNLTNKDLEKDAEKSDIDKTDEEENHSTAADGGELLEDTGTEKPAATSEGNLPDPESISDNEDGEYDRGKIKDK